LIIEASFYLQEDAFLIVIPTVIQKSQGVTEESGGWGEIVIAHPKKPY
jgi:hypothetical protein